MIICLCSYFGLRDFGKKPLFKIKLLNNALFLGISLLGILLFLTLSLNEYFLFFIPEYWGKYGRIDGYESPRTVTATFLSMGITWIIAIMYSDGLKYRIQKKKGNNAQNI